MDPKVLCIIPARGGSKGLPGKNIKLLNEHPLIAYSIRAAQKSSYLERIIVSTDDEEIASVAKDYKAEIPYLRDPELATDSSNVVDVVIELLNYLEANNKDTYDYVCLLQCTTPLTQGWHIDEAIKKCIDHPKMDAVVSMCEAEVNPLWTVKIQGEKLIDFIPGGNNIIARQQLEQAYRVNGGIYITKVESLRATKTFMPNNTMGYVMDQIYSIDIDTQYDFDLCEFILNTKMKKAY